jgi:hypothetical protein
VTIASFGLRLTSTAPPPITCTHNARAKVNKGFRREERQGAGRRLRVILPGMPLLVKLL